MHIDFGTDPGVNRPGQPRLALPPRDALLLARLHLDGRQARGALAAWLWPESEGPQAQANLRQRIKRLQDATGGLLLQVDAGSVALADGLATSLEPAPDADSPLALQAPLLPDLDAQRPESAGAAVQAWLVAARRRLRQQQQQRGRARLRELEAAQRLDAALALAQWLAADDPDDAEAVRALMRLHHARGETAFALRAYRAHRQHLRRQLRTAPDAATQALAETLAGAADGGLGRGPARGPAPAPEAAAPPAAWGRRLDGTGPPPWLPPDHPGWALLARPPARVQRDAAWAQLQALARHGGTAWLLGPGGLGKTRLSHDFCEDQAVPLRLACRPGQQTVPYALLAGWVHAAQATARTLPAPVRAELARLEPALGAAAPGPLQPALLLQALRALRAQAPACQAVCIDDLHLVDAASLELLPALLADVPCVLLSLRPDEAPPPLHAWMGAAGDEGRPVERIELGAFDVAGVAALLADVGLPGMVPADWAPLLLSHTGGHPFLLLETLRALARGPQPERAEPPHQLPTPPRVRELLVQRLQALSPMARTLAELAALAGEHFSARMATVALGGVAHEAGAAWSELQGGGYLGAAAFGQARLHDLMAEAVRGAMPAPVAVQRHRQVAETLQALGPQPPARLAHHWAEAGEPHRAAQLHEAAAERAKTLSRVHEQVAELDRAAVQWTLAHEPARAFEARLQAAEARITHQQLQEGLAQAQALLDDAGDVAQRTAAQRLLAIAHAYRYQHEPALRWATAAHAGAWALGRAGWQADAAGIAAMSEAMLGHPAQAQAWLALLREVAADQLDWRIDINRHTSASNALAQLGQTAEALAELEQALALSAQPELQLERAAMLGNAAALSVRLGLAPQTLRHATQALALAEPLADRDGAAPWVNACVHAGLGQIMLGHLDDALRSLERARERCADPALAYWQVTIDNHLAWLWIQLGQPARALRVLQEPDAPLNPAHRARRWTLRVDLRRLCGAQVPLPPPPPGGPGDLGTSALFELALAVERRDARRAEDLQALQARLDAQGLAGGASWIGLHALEARAERAEGADATAAAQLAPEALALWHQVQQRCCLAAYRPEVLVRLAALLARTGPADAAAAARAEAHAWLQRAEQRLRGSVWHEGFLQRNLVNAALWRGA